MYEQSLWTALTTARFQRFQGFRSLIIIPILPLLFLSQLCLHVLWRHITGFQVITMGWENGAQFSAPEDNIFLLFMSVELSLHFCNRFLAIPTDFSAKTI